MEESALRSFGDC